MVVSLLAFELVDDGVVWRLGDFDFRILALDGGALQASESHSTMESFLFLP